MIITNGKKSHYLVVTNLSALLQRISSNHKEDFYCLNCFKSYTTKNKLKNMKKFAIYLDLECLLKKLQFSQNNPKKSCTEKKAKREPSGWAMFTRCSFDKKESKLNYYRGKDCIEKLCEKLKKSAMKTINHEEKEMIPLTHEKKFYKEQEGCHICKEIFCMNEDDENYKNKRKVKDHCHYAGKLRGAAHSKCNLNYKVSKDVPIIIHNACRDTHFIINQLAKEFKGEVKCIGKNMAKYITFSVKIKKECDNGKTITHKLKFIDSFRFMPTSL